MVDVITDNLDLWSAAMLNKSNAGRGTSDKQTAYGIKKLRELILELAVRGKLVPQDPNDEPAQALLEIISEQKAKLGKSNKTKNLNILLEISESEKAFEIPSNWDWVRLGDVVDVVRGITFPASEKSKIPEPGRVACLRTTNVQDKIEWEDLLYIRESFVNREEQFICQNDIVMSMANSRELVGKVAIVDTQPDFKTAFGGFLSVLRPILLNPFYITLLLREPINRSKLIDSASQTTNIANVSLSKLNPLPLAIPPLAEQRRIVVKVDELMALCDQLEQQQTDSIAAHQTLVQTLLDTLTQAADATEFEQAWSRIADHFDTLFTTEASIDQFKQTLLQLAVMGKLVSQSPDDEPASELLAKIAIEQTKSGKGRTAKNKPETDLGQKANLPVGWEFALFQDITKVITCGMASTPKYYDSGRMFLSAKNVKPYRFMPDDHKFVDEETYRKITQNAKPEKGDILLTRVGAGIGEAALIDQDIDFAYYVSLTLIKPYLQYFDSSYLLHWLNSPEGVKKSLDNIYGTGMSQGNLNVNQVRMFLIPIPPLNEQHRIAAKVDELMALCDALKARIAAAQTTQLQLTDAIVEQAVA